MSLLSLLVSILRKSSSPSLSSKASDHLHSSLLYPHQQPTFFLCCGPQTWLQYCRWRLTKTEQRGTVTSLTLLAIPVLMQDTAGVLGCKQALLAPVQLFYLNSQVLLRSASLNSSPSPYSHLGLMSYNKSKCKVGFVVTHQVSMVQLFMFVQIPQDVILLLYQLHHSDWRHQH